MTAYHSISRSQKAGRNQSFWCRHILLAMMSVFAFLAIQSLPSAASDEANARPAPRLVLQITVDALRGDLPSRFAQVLGDGELPGC